MHLYLESWKYWGSLPYMVLECSQSYSEMNMFEGSMKDLVNSLCTL